MSAQEQQSPSYDSLLVIAQSVCAALARAGVTDCDDPGEAIDVMRENLEARVAFLESERRRLQESASAPQPPSGGEIRVSARRVVEAIENGDGFWRPCSGCYETSDGYNVHGFPFSTTFQCHLGGGCHECGGLGAVWDTTDYAAFGDEMAAAMAAQEKGGDTAPPSAPSCGACSDGCVERGSCRVRDESPPSAPVEVEGLPSPAAVKYPDSGLRDDAHALSLWNAHGYDTGGQPLYSADHLHSYAAHRVQLAQQPAAVDGAWRQKAAEWLVAKAALQEANNQRWPEHAATYNAWRERPGVLRQLASEVLAAQPGGDQG
ncbi:MAG TPA: hypothetical protein VIG97_03385 [Luteimonas sp.]